MSAVTRRYRPVILVTAGAPPLRFYCRANAMEGAMFDRVSRPQNSSLIETLALADNQLDEVAGGFTPQQLAQMQDTSNKTQTTAQKAAEQADAFIRS